MTWGRHLAALLLAFAFPLGPAAHYQFHGKVYLPDDSVTPGVIRTSDQSAICDKDFRTAPFRKTTQSMKDHVYTAYGVERNKGVCAGGCEVDHRVPLELGGLDDIRNLWPEPSRPVPGFHQKDILENYLKHSVCIDQTMTLKQAQAALMGDWYKAYVNAHLGGVSKTGSESATGPLELRAAN